jgi:hypothetical protein
MADITVGNRMTATPTSWLTLDGTPGQAAILFSVTQSCLCYSIGARMRKNSGSPQVQFAIWDTASNVPTARLGYTNAQDVVGSSSGSGTLQEASVKHGVADNVTGVTGSAIRLIGGHTYALGVQVDGGDADIALVSSLPTVQVFKRDTGSVDPTATFSPDATSTSRPLAVYGTATLSTAPTVTMTGPAASVSTATPTITGTFADAESGAPTRDRVRGYWIEVQTDTGTTIWQSPQFTTPSPGIPSSFSTVYSGPTLSNGNYQVRARAEDDVMLEGDFSAWRSFAITNLGSIDMTAATPNTKLASGQSGTFGGAKWTHPSSLSATQAKVQVLAGGAVQRFTPAYVSITAVPVNGFISLTQAQAAVATSTSPLPPGDYQWQMRAKDSAGNESAWSDLVSFSVNAPPNMPSLLDPLSGLTWTAPPLLRAKVTDPDLDDVPGQISAVFEITRPDSSIATHEVTTYDNDVGKFYYQTTTSDVPVTTTTVPYQFRVRGHDLDGVSPNDLGPWTSPATFFYTAAPVPTITSPIGNAQLTTGTPTINWSSSLAFVKYVVRLYHDQAVDPFFSSGQVTVTSATTGSYTVPAGWLENSTSYQADVTVYTSGGVSGQSERTRFTIGFTPADVLTGISVSLLAYQEDVEPVSVLLSWSRTAIPTTEFRGYVIRRRTAEQDPDDAIIIRRIQQPGQTSWVDHHAPPNTSLIYSISQLRRASNGDVTQSTPILAPIDLPLTTPVLASLLNGSGLRAAVMWLSDDISGGLTRADVVLDTWGTGGAPTWIRPPANYGQNTVNLGWTLVADSRGSLHDNFLNIKALVESGDPFSLRTETERIFCRLVPSARWWRRGAVGQILVNLVAEEIAWNEVISIPG